MPKHAKTERRTVRIYMREAIVWGSLTAGVYAAGWWFSAGRIFELGAIGMLPCFGLGAAIGLIMEWQLDDDNDDSSD